MGKPVSYTHLDVYKRQIVETSIEKGQVAEDSNDTEMSEQLTSDTTVSVDEAAKIDVYKRQAYRTSTV